MKTSTYSINQLLAEEADSSKLLTLTGGTSGQSPIRSTPHDLVTPELAHGPYIPMPPDDLEPD